MGTNKKETQSFRWCLYGACSLYKKTRTYTKRQKQYNHHDEEKEEEKRRILFQKEADLRLVV